MAPFVVPAVGWRVLGWTRGEVFYDGRPTSYWESRLRQCQMHNAGEPYFVPPKPTPTEEWVKRYLGVRLWSDWNPEAVLKGPAATPVLIELLESDDLTVQMIAMRSLNSIPADAMQASAKIREIRRTTDDYLVFVEASRALRNIDKDTFEDAKEDRSDCDQLYERYNRTLSILKK